MSKHKHEVQKQEPVAAEQQQSIPLEPLFTVTAENIDRVYIDLPDIVRLSQPVRSGDKIIATIHQTYVYQGFCLATIVSQCQKETKTRAGQDAIRRLDPKDVPSEMTIKIAELSTRTRTRREKQSLESAAREKIEKYGATRTEGARATLHSLGIKLADITEQMIADVLETQGFPPEGQE